MTKKIILLAAVFGVLGTACDRKIGVPEDPSIDVCTLDWIDGCTKPDKPGDLGH
jgi:hypothetical protein